MHAPLAHDIIVAPTGVRDHSNKNVKTYLFLLYNVFSTRPAGPAGCAITPNSINMYIHWNNTFFFCESVRTTKGILSYLRTPKLFHVIVGDCGWEDDPNAFHFPCKCHLIPPIVYRETRGRGVCINLRYEWCGFCSK